MSVNYKEGSWAREYRQGRAEQVKQQRISHLIAISASPRISIESRNWAANEALKALGVPATHSDEPAQTKGSQA